MEIIEYYWKYWQLLVIFGNYWKQLEIVENFTSEKEKLSPAKMADLIEDLNTSLKDDLNIDKHRGAYQDALSQMHENVNLSILKTLSDTKSSIPDDEELQRIQNLRQYRDTLSELEEHLDEIRH